MLLFHTLGCPVGELRHAYRISYVTCTYTYNNRHNYTNYLHLYLTTPIYMIHIRLSGELLSIASPLRLHASYWDFHTVHAEHAYADADETGREGSGTHIHLYTYTYINLYTCTPILYTTGRTHANQPNTQHTFAYAYQRKASSQCRPCPRSLHPQAKQVRSS
jgi:hypothetical protein